VFKFSEEIEVRRHLCQVAFARAPADLVLGVGKLLEVHHGVWLDDWEIVISRGRIAWTGPAGEWKGEAAERRSHPGLWAVPGFGEPHKHIESSYLSPEFEAALVLPHGNTWIVEGSHEFSNVNGAHNAEFWLTPRLHGSPLKIFPAIGSATPPSPYEQGGGYYDYAAMREQLETSPWVTALDEVMDLPRLWNPDMPGHGRLWEVIQATFDARRQVEGHGAFLQKADEVSAFAAAGLSGDHEVFTGADAYAKLLRGIFLEVRPFFSPDALKYLVEKGVRDWNNVSLTTDDRDVVLSLEIGTANYNVRCAIASGVPIPSAYAMASLYPARHMRIDHWVGSIAPGRFADVVLLRDTKEVDIAAVYADGRLVAEDGRALFKPPTIAWPDWATRTVNIGRVLSAADFGVRAPVGRKSVSAAVLGPFFFKPEFPVVELPVRDGCAVASPETGLNKFAVVDRLTGLGGVSTIFWRGVCMRAPGSAMCCSASHDKHNIWCLGNDDAAMALAVNTCATMQGGWVLVKGGAVLDTVRLEIGGLMAARPPEQLAAEFRRLFSEGLKLDFLITENSLGLFREGEFPRFMIYMTLTCSPFTWCLVAPTPACPGGFVNVQTGKTHAIVW
jgi:adenine deaminase